MMSFHYPRIRLIALSLVLLSSANAWADELMKWERIPLQIPLKVGQERIVFVDKNVRVGFPATLNGKLRVQSTGGAVYLKAESAFPQTRFQLQDVESGEVIVLDVRADENGPSEPVRLVYSGEVSSISRKEDVQSNSPPSPDTAKQQQIKYSAPLPVLLTRYAAQNLYAPIRTVEAVPGIRPINPHLPKRLSTLYPSEPLTIMPMAAWAAADRVVVALRLQNISNRKIILDPRALQGQFITATFQHRWLEPSGTPEDTTTVYIVTGSRPETAFIAEPVAAPKAIRAGKKRGKDAD
ncbi:TIGR03749 family integrating conjugative element protein [Pantoea cypripedii]|uniref:TIGR03749 family integrating conjugative element protein n=1 Tax=Pantoea cypripedii TaxID=55209 RepID=UPI002FC728A6